MLCAFICREEKLCLGSKQTLVAKIYYFCVLNRNTSIMSNIKIGDKIRFLNTTGGGIVRRFQGKDQVLVEDEDGTFMESGKGFDSDERMENFIFREMIDGDAGLRSLYHMLSVSEQLVFDISDVIAGNC